MSVTEQRLFFALWPGEVECSALAALQRTLSEQRGRPTHPLDFHITLAFLGAVTAERLVCVEQAADTVRAPGFALDIDQVGYWPHPRILWCGPRSTPAVLLQLVTDLARALEACGFMPERRAFSTHVTLVREAHYLANFALAEPIPWHAQELVLAVSRRDREPPRYQVLRRWPLG
jgi:RNA 2',3'-cyclic 3'-phosphodiesterase